MVDTSTEARQHGCLTAFLTLGQFLGSSAGGALTIHMIEPTTSGVMAFFFLPLVYAGAVAMCSARMVAITMWKLITSPRKLFTEAPQVGEEERRRVLLWVLPGAALSAMIQATILACWAPHYGAAFAKLTLVGVVHGVLVWALARKHLVLVGEYLDFTHDVVGD